MGESTIPGLYDDVLVFGGGSPSTDGPPVAQIGGFWRQPDYGRSYLLAARYVIECGHRDSRQNEVAVPAAYLQRHALELALKELIEGARSIKADRAWLEALKLDGKAPSVAAKKLKFGHDLQVLIRWLGTGLAEIGYGEVPGEFVALAGKMAAVEGSDPTRVRYAKGIDGRESFPKPVMIPVGETQRELEGLFQKHLRVVPHGGSGLGNDLAEEAHALAQEIYALDEI